MGLQGRARDDLAHEAVAGTLGAMLMLGAGSKLYLSGADWFNGAGHCATMYEHQLLAPSVIWSPIRELVVEQMWICSFGAVFAVVVEALGFVMIWPSLRKAYAVLVLLLFFSLLALYGIMELSWAAMACGLAWSHLGGPFPLADAPPVEPEASVH